ncbi:calcium-binding protein [Natribaculum luteum]|uniref:Calcium-binding protein n=1 Tax=Natribaculum luteum TaxID=1586232 RepID=A0ABD5P0N1_9EURY|nr:calcium-binding protein [Natribaculum luteum]
MRKYDDSNSRREFIQKGGLTASALALGVTATGTATAQQNERALVFSYNYLPEADFTVVGRLRKSLTVDLLEVDGEMVDEISQPDEWNGHVIRYDVDGGSDAAGITTFLFLQNQTLDSGDTASTSADASMFSSELNLLNTSIDE